MLVRIANCWTRNSFVILFSSMSWKSVKREVEYWTKIKYENLSFSGTRCGLHQVGTQTTKITWISAPKTPLAVREVTLHDLRFGLCCALSALRADIIWYCYLYYLLTAIGLTPGGSNTVHIYTQAIHRITQLTTHSTTQLTTNLEECGPCPVFASYTLAFALQLRKKHGKT